MLRAMESLMPRTLRVALILTPAFALVAAGLFYVVREFNAPLPPDSREGSRLVVVVVFDQMRGDYLDRWSSAFGEDGFEKMKHEGVWYSDAHLPYACTSTGPGHASIATGVPPSVHGIVENEWYVRERGKRVYCSHSDRPYERVPLHADVGVRSKAEGGLAPDRLLVPTVADHLRTASQGKGRTYSFALKDRVAVLMGGKEPDGCYCFDTATGEFHTSSYYRDRVHPWVETFNNSKACDRWFQKDWSRIGAAVRYDQLAGPDEAPGEPLDRRLPFTLGRGYPAPNKRYYDALESSPFANELLWELARTGIEAEDLGNRGTPDLLYLGFSANDAIGHACGPDSHEVLDITLRSDRLVAEMVAYLTKRFGPNQFTLVVTADHGVAPLPERSVKALASEYRFHPGEYGQLGIVLDEKFGQRDAAPGQWVEAIGFPWVYLNQKSIARHGIPRTEIEDAAAQWLGHRPLSQAAYPRAVLAGPPLADPIGRAAQLSYHPDRSGDVLIVTKPYALPLGWPSVGTSHGTPHPYDTHVPILAYGHGIPALKKRGDRTNALIVAPIVCRALGIKAPSRLSEKLPAGFGGR